MDNTTVSIVGCGWLGLPLAKHLISQGLRVRGSKTQADELSALKAENIDAHQLALTPSLQGDSYAQLFDCDVLIVNVPPGRKRNDASFHIAQLEALLAHLPKSQAPKLLFVSSTSVYANDAGLVGSTTHLNPSSESGKALSYIETKLLPDYSGSWSVLRLSGLIGPQRKPGRFFATRSLKDPESPVNLIHRDDCIAIISDLIKRDVWGEKFNACCDEHPSKRSFYKAAAKALAISAPKIEENTPPNPKFIDNTDIKKALNYQFIYPDPIRWVELSEKQDV